MCLTAGTSTLYHCVSSVFKLNFHQKCAHGVLSQSFRSLSHCLWDSCMLQMNWGNITLGNISSNIWPVNKVWSAEEIKRVCSAISSLVWLMCTEELSSTEWIWSWLKHSVFIGVMITENLLLSCYVRTNLSVVSSVFVEKILKIL